MKRNQYLLTIFLVGVILEYYLKGGSMNVGFLKNFQVRSGIELDELLGVKSDLSDLMKTYDDMSITVPDWITDKLGEVEIEIKTIIRVELQAKLKKAETKRAGLMTVGERRDQLDKEIEALKDALK